jgi:hypothetical protein
LNFYSADVRRTSGAFTIDSSTPTLRIGKFK